MQLCSREDLLVAWKYARRDAADNFVFDVIDYEDAERNLDHIVRRLELEIKGGQYTPAPLLSVNVPKTLYSVRPGAIVSLPDLILLYALVRKVAPALDTKLSPAVLSYRWLPENKDPRPLFAEVEDDEYEGDEILPSTLFAPYPPFADTTPAGWFRGWIEYHERAKDSASRYGFCAIGDVTAYFENVAVSSLFDRISNVLGGKHEEALTQLRAIYEFWGWRPAGATARGKVLPQGNDISLFLSNFFLTDLDDNMGNVVGGDPRRYLRYVDDFYLFADSQEESHEALLACDQVLRDLSLSLNPEKTKVIPAANVFDEEVERWLEDLSPSNADAVESAREFLTRRYDPNDPEKWERLYLRALTTLQRGDDAFAVPYALKSFLENPSYKLLVKNFDYLSYFAPDRRYAEELAAALTRKAFMFPYHKHYLYRLGAYGGEDSPALRETALQDARPGDAEWYVRMAALFCLNSFRLNTYELNEIEELAERESHPSVVRAALVALRQRPLDEVSSAWDQILFATAPGQENLREYFFRVVTEEDLARSVLNEIAETDVSSRAFVKRFHQLDLLKSNAAVREELLAVLERKLDECNLAWRRLRDRLAGIKELATEATLRHSEKRKAAQALGHLETVLHGSREAIIITDVTGEIQIWNDAASDLLGYDAPEALGRNLTQLFEPAGGFKSAGELLTFVAESGGSLTEEVIPYRRPDRTALTVSANYSVITGPAGEPAGLSVLLRDVTAEIRAAKIEQFEAAAEKLLSETSGRFVAPKDLDETITQTLEDTAELLEANRAYFFRLRDDGISLVVTHEWAEPGVPLLRTADYKIELNRLALLKYQLLGRYAAVVADAETQPPSEKDTLQKRGARAALGVPVHIGRELAGLVGCDDMRRPRNWEPVEVNLLFSVTALISKAIERKGAEEALRESELELSIRNRIANIFLTKPNEDMYSEVLEVILETLESPLGAFGYVDENGALVYPSLARRVRDECRVAKKDNVFPRESWEGIWGRALIEKRALYSNEPFDGPKGHIPIRRALDVPIVHYGEAIGNLLLNNKPTDYTEKDRAMLTAIADYIAPVLHARLQSNLKEKARQRAEEALKRRSEEITAVNELAIELATAVSTGEMFAIICTKLKDITGALATITASYDENADELALNYIVAETKVLKKGNKILGIDAKKLRFPAKRYEPQEKASDRVVISAGGIPEKAYKVIPKKVCKAIEQAFNLGTMYELLFHDAGKMMGTAEVIMRKGSAPLSTDTLEAFAHVAAAALQRKSAEEGRRESEERYRSLINTISEGFGIQDENGVITYVNDRFCEMVGYTREELISQPATDFLDHENANKMREQSAKRGKGRGGYYEVVWTGKESQHVHTTVTPGVLHDGEGYYAGSFATFTDITGRKRAEERLKESEEQYSNIVELAPDGIITLDSKGTVTSCNKAFLKLTGFSKPEIVGKHFTKLPTLNAKDITQYIKMFKSTIRGKVPEPFEFSWFDKENNVRKGEIYATLMRRGRKVVGILVVTRDVTYRKRAEEEGRRRAEGYRALNEFALELANAASRKEIYKLIGDRLQAMTVAVAVLVNTLDPDKKVLNIEYINVPDGLLSKANEIIGRKVKKLHFPVRDCDLEKIVREKVTEVGSIADIAFGAISEAVAERIKEALGLGNIYGVALHHGGELMGAAIVLTRKDNPPLPLDELRMFGDLAAAALRRKHAEEELMKYGNLIKKSVERGLPNSKKKVEAKGAKSKREPTLIKPGRY